MKIPTDDPTHAREARARNAELLAVDRAFAAASRELGAAEAFARWLHPQALLLPDGGRELAGAASIVPALRASLAGAVLAWEPRAAEVAASGELGWSWGEWTLGPATGGGATARGKYLNVWRRGPDGWKLAVDMGNSSPAAEAGA